jgi:hypothetical protein
MSFLDRVRACHGFRPQEYRRFVVAGETVGWVLPGFADTLRPYDVFSVEADSVRLSERFGDFAQRTRAVHEVLKDLVRDGKLRKLRNEPYPVGTGWGKEPLLTVDRAVVPSFGVEAYGIHVNGFVRAKDGLKIWVGRRAKDKATAPGKLDHLIAGGHPYGISLTDNLIKEAREEANMPEALVRQAAPVGAVSYRLRNEEGLRNDILFIYDLELPESFTPKNTDGEVEEFFLRPVEKVMQVLSSTDDFKFNVALVAIDFLIRHGYITPDDRDYEALVHGRCRGWGEGE